MEDAVLSKQGCWKPLNTDFKPITSELIFTEILILILIDYLGYASTALSTSCSGTDLIRTSMWALLLFKYHTWVHGGP